MIDKKIRTPIAAVLLVVKSILQPVIWMLGGFLQFVGLTAWAALIIDVLLAVLLFRKKRDLTLVITIGCTTVLTLIDFVRFVTVGGLFELAAAAALLVLAVVLCEQTFLKADLEKFKELASKFFYIPAGLSLLTVVLSLPTYGLLTTILSAGIMLSLGAWLKDPYVRSVDYNYGTTGCENDEYSDGYFSLGLYILLCVLTGGLWTWVWIYRTTKFLNRAPYAEYYSPVSKLLLCIFIPFYEAYWFYRHAQRMDSIARERNVVQSDISVLCMILGLFLPGIAALIMQDRINIISRIRTQPE